MTDEAAVTEFILVTRTGIRTGTASGKNWASMATPFFPPPGSGPLENSLSTSRVFLLT